MSVVLTTNGYKIKLSESFDITLQGFYSSYMKGNIPSIGHTWILWQLHILIKYQENV